MSPDSRQTIEHDLALLARQQAELLFPCFDEEIAWLIGTHLRTIAFTRTLPVVIDIRRFGSPAQPLFYAAMPSTTPDHARWVTRKSNTVALFHRASYAIGLSHELKGTTLATKHALPEDLYAAHGGSVPICIANCGVIGSITVSGLTSRADHELIIEALCQYLRRDYESLRLP